MKPQLADNWLPDSQVLSVWGQPKIDGVRGLNLTGILTGRSLKVFKNKALTAAYSWPSYIGLDGELAAGDQCSSSLCRDTTSVTNTINGTSANVDWHVFDYVTPAIALIKYALRYEMLRDKLADLQDPTLKLVPYELLTTMEEIEAFDERCLAAGYEGSILRNFNAAYKPGRPSTKIQELMRIKRFSDSEALVLGIVEGRNNQNEAVINELGRSERSSHAENQTPSGMVGVLLCRDLATGMHISVSPGEMDHTERKVFFDHPELIVGKIVVYKSFKKGVKVAPRFATYKCIRSDADMPAKE